MLNYFRALCTSIHTSRRCSIIHSMEYIDPMGELASVSMRRSHSPGHTSAFIYLATFYFNLFFASFVLFLPFLFICSIYFACILLRSVTNPGLYYWSSNISTICVCVSFNQMPMNSAKVRLRMQ